MEYRCPAERDWTPDIWFVDEPDRQPGLEHPRTLPPRLTDERRRAILRIRSELTAPGHEIYRAVLDHGITTAEQFREQQVTTVD